MMMMNLDEAIHHDALQEMMMKMQEMMMKMQELYEW